MKFHAWLGTVSTPCPRGRVPDCASLLCAGPDLPVGGARGRLQGGSTKLGLDPPRAPHSSEHPCWLRFFTPMVAFPVHSSGRLKFAVFLTLTEPLSSHRLRDPNQLSGAFSELRPSRTGRGFQKWYPPPSPPPGDSHSSHHHRRRIYLALLLSIWLPS